MLDTKAIRLMKTKLEQGICNKEFVLYYQPQYDLKTKKVLGAEALIRWEHPNEGIIAPDQFIPYAESSGQIFEIDYWVIKNALEQKQKWEEQGLSDIDLSINLSGMTIVNEEAFSNIVKVIDTYPVDKSKIIIEITETVKMKDLDFVIQQLRRLRERKIRIALDDFGTGYCSFLYLTKLPLDIIKLDRSYVQTLPENKIGTALVKNVLNLAHDLSYQVVAEGIESDRQLKFLKRNKCPVGQGYYFKKPLSIESMNNIVLDNHPMIKEA